MCFVLLESDPLLEIPPTVQPSETVAGEGEDETMGEKVACDATPIAPETSDKVLFLILSFFAIACE
jgi:hypothetical protein